MKNKSINQEDFGHQKQSISISPPGESFAMPLAEDCTEELRRLQKLVKTHRKLDREIIVVMGVGLSAPSWRESWPTS